MEHHVYFWLKDEYLGDAEREQFETGLDKLLALDGIERGHWGRPAAVADRPVVDKSFHYALSLEFASLAAHDEYQTAPGHKEFLNNFSSWWTQVKIYDLD